MAGNVVPFPQRHARASAASRAAAGKHSSAVTSPPVAVLIATANGADIHAFRLRMRSTVVRAQGTPCSRIKAAMDSSSKLRADMNSESCMPANVYHAHIFVKGKCASDAMEPGPGPVHDLHMRAEATKRQARKPKQKGRTYRVTFMVQWRKRAGLTQEAAAARIGKTHGQLSRLETGKSAYSQPVVEALAALYGCTPEDLIGRDPSAGNADSTWDKLSPERRELALRLLEAAEGASNALDRKQSAA